MYTIHTLPAFDQWLAGVRDRSTRIRLLLRRLERFQVGQWGDSKPVGDGVMEAREHFGPGWRKYYLIRGSDIIVRVMLESWGCEGLRKAT